MADYTVTAANVVASAYAVRLAPNLIQPTAQTITSFRPGINVAGAAITAGQPVYQNPATGDFFPADANGTSPLYKVIGIAENTAGIGQPVSIITEDPNFTPGITTLVIGDVVIVSATAGGLTEAANKASGWFVSVVMVAYSTTQAVLKIIRADAAKV